MGQAWAYMNLKGGIGKTTLSANISRAMSDLKPLKILLVDTDPQSSLTLIFKNEAEVDKLNEDDTFYDILCNPTNFMDQKIKHCALPLHHSNGSQIDLIPSHIQLISPMIAAMISGATAGQAARFDQMRANFKEFIARAKENYDLVVLDTNPSGNIATFLAIGNADFIVAPVTGDRFAIRGVSLMREVFEKEFDWLRKEPWRLVPIINNVRDRTEGIKVRDQLHARGRGLGDQALTEYVFRSGFLTYTEKKQGFAVDRRVLLMIKQKQQSMRDNLRSVALALREKTKVCQ
jgi:chromosome partitioning protein